MESIRKMSQGLSNVHQKAYSISSLFRNHLVMAHNAFGLLEKKNINGFSEMRLNLLNKYIKIRTWKNLWLHFMSCIATFSLLHSPKL